MLGLTLRNLAARKVRALLSVLSIVLGTAFLAGVFVFSSGLSATIDELVQGGASDAAVRFEYTRQATSGEITNLLSPQAIEEFEELPEVARAEGLVTGWNAYLLDAQGDVVGAGSPTTTLTPLESRNVLGQPLHSLTDGRWPREPGEIAVDAATAAAEGFVVGQEVTFVPPASTQPDAKADPSRTVTVVGLATASGAAMTRGPVIFLDLSEAQEVFLVGNDAYSGAVLTASDGVSEVRLAGAARGIAPDGFTVSTGADQMQDAEEQIGGLYELIRSFLAMFAVIGVVVGGFVIGNTLSILVAQRTRELALLRALGTSRRQVSGSVVLEALLTALVGSTVGVALGLGLARALAGAFARAGLTIDRADLVLTPAVVVTAYVVGVVVTVAAAYVVARRAARVAPMVALCEDLPPAPSTMRLRTIVGLAVAAAGGVAAYIGLNDPPGPDSVWVGAAAVIWVLTAAYLAPVLGQPVLLLTRAVMSVVFSMPGRLAGDNALRNPRRTGATASALMIGLALTSALGVLAASLHGHTTRLVAEQFPGDFLVTSAGGGAFSTDIGDEMAAVEGVATLSRQQVTPAFVDGAEATLPLSGIDRAFDTFHDLEMVEGTQRRGKHGALVSQSTAEEFGYAVGDRLELLFPTGATVEVTVVGEFVDTEVVAGFAIAMGVLDEAGVIRQDNRLTVSAEGTDPGELAAIHEDLGEVVGHLPTVTVQDEAQFTAPLTAQVDRLLYLVYALVLLAVVIAVGTVVNTLSLSVVERTREIGLLRAVGLTRRMVRVMVTLESVVIALMGSVLGLGLGVLIGVLLQRVLAEQLTVLVIPLAGLGWFLVLAVLVGVLAAALPASKAARMNALSAVATQ